VKQGKNQHTSQQKEDILPPDVCSCPTAARKERRSSKLISLKWR